MENEVDLGVRRIEFGGGVAQLQRKSLAPPRRKFSIQFTRNTETIEDIYQFLIKNRGKRFMWVRPSGERIKVSCSEMKRKEDGFPESLSCVFEEEIF